KIRIQACLAEDFLNGDAVRSHYERTETALSAIDNGIKHFLEHVGLQLRTLTAQTSRPRSVRARRTVRQRSIQQLRLSSRSSRRLLRLRLLLQLGRGRRVARRITKR